MAEHVDREAYIPLRRADLVELLGHDPVMSGEERTTLRQLAELMAAHFHHEHHLVLDRLKCSYAPFDPDQDTVELKERSAEEKQKKLNDLFEEFDRLLMRANFRRMTQDELMETFKIISAWGIKMEVDLDVFERLEVYARGERQTHRPIRLWKKFWKTIELSVDVYSRLVIIVKFKQTPQGAENICTEDVFLKIFKDIPKADLEMLLPGARVRFNSLDRGRIGFPIITGLLITGWNIIKTSVLGLVTGGGTLMLWGVAAGTFGYGYRTYYNYNWTKTRYNLRLTRNLYYQNLDNNAGVLFRLIDEAEEQECREALLAYFMLWKYSGSEGWTLEELDDHVEHYLNKHVGLKIDFEIKDAMAKMERFQLVEKVGEDRYRSIAPNLALKRLDDVWDSHFQYQCLASVDTESHPAAADPASTSTPTS